VYWVVIIFCYDPPLVEPFFRSGCGLIDEVDSFPPCSFFFLASWGCITVLRPRCFLFITARFELSFFGFSSVGVAGFFFAQWVFFFFGLALASVGFDPPAPPLISGDSALPGRFLFLYDFSPRTLRPVWLRAALLPKRCASVTRCTRLWLPMTRELLSFVSILARKGSLPFFLLHSTPCPLLSTIAIFPPSSFISFYPWVTTFGDFPMNTTPRAQFSDGGPRPMLGINPLG